ncbi:hypothetical protein KFL_014680010 [Klebsormidium nitens]|uniref:Uncharacterized protein n=1 Tax=Klebsormidium nitens TaxID=105231 RepID=A0A1Y1IUR4_KLENI|nr:hypothetical protein KFL_014680010 [Klebsormidium nitens]|eukprot:GAQ93359.1 hypothetical protein KFL_014680010 [Klebsormidium nitens]
MAKRKYTLQIADGMSVDINIERKRTEGNVRVYTAAEAIQEKERKAAERERVREEKKARLLKERKAKEDERNEKKIAEILALADETRQMIREMREVVEQIDSEEVLLKDKVAGLFKLMRCAMYESDEIEVEEVPEFLDRCTLCGTAKSLHEVFLALDDELHPAWMCLSCRTGLARSVAFDERLTMVRQERRRILEELMGRDDPLLKGIYLTFSEIFDKMQENSRRMTAAEEAEEKKVDARVSQLAKWDKVESKLPTYESLKALSTLTEQLPKMRNQLEPVESTYMQFFSEKYEDKLIKKSVANRISASKRRCDVVVETLRRIEENGGETLGDDLAGMVLREIERQSMRETYVNAVAKERKRARERSATGNPNPS